MKRSLLRGLAALALLALAASRAGAYTLGIGTDTPTEFVFFVDWKSPASDASITLGGSSVTMTDTGTGIFNFTVASAGINNVFSYKPAVLQNGESFANLYPGFSGNLHSPQYNLAAPGMPMPNGDFLTTSTFHYARAVQPVSASDGGTTVALFALALGMVAAIHRRRPELLRLS